MDYRIFEAVIDLMFAIKQRNPSASNDDIQCLVYSFIEQFAEDIKTRDAETIKQIDDILALIQHHKVMSQS